MNDYNADLQIEKHSLDEEWLKQPALFMRYAEVSADADEARDAAKRQLEVQRAIADSEVRQAAEDAGEKLTEAKVAVRVALSSAVAEAEALYIKACKEARLLSAAVKAFEQRKKALENLAALWSQGYFSTPSQNTRISKTGDAIRTRLRSSLELSADEEEGEE